MSGEMPRRDLEAHLERLFSQISTVSDELFTAREDIRPLSDRYDQLLADVAKTFAANREQIFVGGVQVAEIGGMNIVIDEVFALDTEACGKLPYDLQELYEALVSCANDPERFTPEQYAPIHEHILKVPCISRRESISIEDKTGNNLVDELPLPFS